MNLLNAEHENFAPLSYKESGQESVELSQKLETYLRSSDFFESEDAAHTRERALGKLDFLVKHFVKQIAPDSETKNYGGKIFTSGSYRLGVHDKGADIDVLCVVPRHVSRKDFFSVFYGELKKDENVTELSKIEEAYVPLIKLKYLDIPIDILFARLNIPVIKENISLLNDSILKSMDEKCILSLNGSRVADAMLNRVPNVDVFHSALRAVKFWAKRRHIYGNTFGYFGGVAYAICTARICQMFPNMCAYDIFCKFLEVFSTWKWPNPIQIAPIIDHNYNLKVWNPKLYPADKYHKMPVITPVYPCMCSTYNVTQSTFNIMTAEFQRGHNLMKNSSSFEELFEYSNFFRRYKLFVEVCIKSEDEEDYKVWEGYVESKIRILCTKLENLGIVTNAIPFPKAFRMDDTQPTDSAEEGLKTKHLCCWFFIAFEIALSKNMPKKIFIDEPINDFLEFVNSWDNKTEGMTIEINSRKKKDVLNFLRAF